MLSCGKYFIVMFEINVITLSVHYLNLVLPQLAESLLPVEVFLRHVVRLEHSSAVREPPMSGTPLDCRFDNGQIFIRAESNGVEDTVQHHHHQTSPQEKILENVHPRDPHRGALVVKTMNAVDQHRTQKNRIEGVEDVPVHRRSHSQHEVNVVSEVCQAVHVDHSDQLKTGEEEQAKLVDDFVEDFDHRVAELRGEKDSAAVDQEAKGEDTRVVSLSGVGY
jgi:hypothetical protein